MIENIRFLPLGETGITVEFGNEISPDINHRVSLLNSLIKKSKIDGIIESVPTYRSLTVYYNPLKISYDDILAILKGLGTKESTALESENLVVEIPVWYSCESGPDLSFVAQHSGKTIDEVIKIHSEPLYLIYMLGFTPGFPYLGGMDEAIAAPRLESPRIKIEAGSVGIAGKQTGIYSLNSPGGWRLIGKTPVRLYDVNKKDPILLKSGEYLRFVPITKEEYDNIQSLEENGLYVPKRYSKGAL